MIDVCQHGSAVRNEAGTYDCPCGAVLDVDGAVVVPAPKRRVRRPVLSWRQARYTRDQSKMVEVSCSHPACGHRWKIWPQNVRKKNWCPTVHQPLRDALSNALRQAKFRRQQR